MIEKLTHAIEAFIDWTGRSVAWLTLGMVLVTFAVVLLRYVFDIGWIALQESVNYMHALVFLIGAAYTLKHNEHVRVDIFYCRLGQRGRAWVDLFGCLLLLLPVTLFIIWTSWAYVLDSWSVYEGSREAGGLAGIFLLKSAILLMAGLLILQALAMLLKSLSNIRRQETD
jgi:TRAP-type mannitol/chloroaromatic compound transport system permease small subunit